MATININDIESMEAVQSGSDAWISVLSTKDHVALHCDYRLAERLEEAFKDYHDWLSSQETGESE